MIAANPSHSFYPERTRRARHALTSQSVSISELCVLRVSMVSSPNLSPFNSNSSTRNLAFFVDALDAASSISLLFATLTKNTRGWGVPSFSENSVPSALKSTRALPLTDPFDAHHYPLAPNSFTTRTSPKRARKPFRIRTSKTKDLKLFRMNTSKKTGRGRGHSSPLLPLPPLPRFMHGTILP
jgi:hypothetical protein